MMTEEELAKQLDHLRAMLANTPELWPKTADELLPFPYGSLGLDLSDADLLELTANAHLRDEDIQRKYPHFYQRLQSNPALRDAFLETLAMMEDEDE